MKKAACLFACLLGLGLFLTSCNNGTTDDQIVGRWECDVMGYIYRIDFEADNTYKSVKIIIITYSDESGTYSVSGNTITFNSTTPIKTSTGTVSGNTITWKGYTFTKVN